MHDNFKNSDVWVRGLYTALFAAIFYLVFILVLLIAVLQFLMKLVTGDHIKQLLELSDALSLYVGQLLRFVTFKDDMRPYPFSDWPTSEAPVAPEKPVKKTARKKRTSKKAASKAASNEDQGPIDAGNDGDKSG